MQTLQWILQLWHDMVHVIRQSFTISCKTLIKKRRDYSDRNHSESHDPWIVITLGKTNPFIYLSFQSSVSRIWKCVPDNQSFSNWNEAFDILLACLIEPCTTWLYEYDGFYGVWIIWSQPFDSVIDVSPSKVRRLEFKLISSWSTDHS